jgi:uncharacterized repeat protein (TIGR03803 family)
MLLTSLAEFCGSGLATSPTHRTSQAVAHRAPVTPVSARRSSTRGSFSRVAIIIFVFCAAKVIALSAQSFQTLHGFSNRGSDGGDPEAALVQGADGNFYGVTAGGGLYAEGTVFKITTGGSLTTVYSFCGPHNCPDGGDPWAGLVQGNDGKRERLGSPIAAVTLYGQSC